MTGGFNSFSGSLSRIVSKTVMAGLPFWGVTIIVGFGPVRALEIVDYFIVNGTLSESFLGASVALSLLIVYFLYAMRFITIRIDRLSEYIKQLSLESSGAQLQTPYRLTKVLAIWLILLGVNSLLFGLPDGFKGIFSDEIPVFAYFFFILASFLWVYCYSMLEICRAGKFPLQLKQFTEDRTLGLKPFGTASFKLASVYAVFPIVVTLLGLINLNVELEGGGVVVQLAPLRPSDIIFIIGLILIGVGLFFLPLLSIHRRLRLRGATAHTRSNEPVSTLKTSDEELGSAMGRPPSLL